MKFFTAIKQSEFAAALLSAAGFNLEKLAAAGDINALKAHLDSLKPTEEASALSAKVTTLTEENATLNAALGAAKSEIETALAASKAAEAQATLFTASLAAAGVKIPAATADKPVDQAAIQGAIDTRVSSKAREFLAARGHTLPLPAEPGEDVTKPGTSAKKEMTHEAFNALKPHEKMQFCTSGGRLV